MGDESVVRSLRRAEHDVDEIFKWLRGHSPLGAQSWFQALEAGVERLATMADSCSAAPDAALLNRDLRQCLFKTTHGRTCRAVFMIADGNVFVLRIRGPGQPLLQDDEI